MSKEFEVKKFEDVITKLKEFAESDNGFVTIDDFKRRDIMDVKPDISENDDYSKILDKYLMETTFKVLMFMTQNRNRLNKYPKIKAVTSKNTSPLVFDIYKSVLDKFKNDYNIDYDLIGTYILTDENVLYLMVDEPMIYHMRDKCEVLEDDDGREYRILNLGTEPSFTIMDDFTYGGSYYPSVNIKPGTVYLKDIETYKEDSKFKGAIIGDPTKNTL